MKQKKELTILESRSQEVVKNNLLVQKSKMQFSASEQKLLNYILSLIKPKEAYPNGIQPLEYEFELTHYCAVVGIAVNGKNYKDMRTALKSLRDKSIILTLENGTQTPISWINKFWSSPRSGRVRIRLDDDLGPWILDQYNNTTRYILLNTLVLDSKYAIRLYEVCASWSAIHSHEYSVKELRTLLMLEEKDYPEFKKFRAKILENSREEINKKTNLNIEFETRKEGRSIAYVMIKIKKKTKEEMVEVIKTANRYLGDFEDSLK